MTDTTSELSFGKRLAQLRQGKSMTQEELGKRAGIHYITVGRLEREDANPRLHTIEALAKALDVSVTRLVR